MDPIILKFREPILFDGQGYTECDLSGLRKLRTADIYAAQLQNGAGLTGSHMEGQNLRYAMTVAQLASGQPRGFFGQLKKRDALGFAGRINGVLNNEVSANTEIQSRKIILKKSVEGVGANWT